MIGPIIIIIACNDDSGNIDRASNIEMLGCEFELRSGTSVRFSMVKPGRFTNGRFTLSGKRWLIHDWTPYYGNMAWNGYHVSRPTAEAFLRWLHERKLYEITSGPSEFFDAFSSDALSDAAIAQLFAKDYGVSAPATAGGPA